MREPLRFSGTMPANLLPFTADLAIDEAAYRKHLRWLADTRGVTGIVANGHAAEVSSLSREERRRALAIALDEVGTRCPVVAGVHSDGTQEAPAPFLGDRPPGRPADCRLRVPAGLRHRLRPRDAGEARRDAACVRGQGLVERHRRLRGEPPGAAGD